MEYEEPIHLVIRSAIRSTDKVIERPMCAGESPAHGSYYYQMVTCLDCISMYHVDEQMSYLQYKSRKFRRLIRRFNESIIEHPEREQPEAHPE